MCWFLALVLVAVAFTSAVGLRRNGALTSGSAVPPFRRALRTERGPWLTPAGAEGRQPHPVVFLIVPAAAFSVNLRFTSCQERSLMFY